MAKGLFLICLAGAAGVAVLPLRAQEGEEAESELIETLIVNRPVAFRLRGEVQFTEDDDELIDQDAEYAAFPTKIYSGEAKLLSEDKKTLTVTYSAWDNRQDLDAMRWSWRIRTPLDSGDSAVLTFRQSHIRDESERDYLYASLDGRLTETVYGMLQYRASYETNEFTGGQVYQYLCWKPTGRMRIGEQAAVSHDVSGNGRPWYADLFATFFLVPERTSLRIKARHYESSENLSYQEYNAYLYQRVGESSWVRLNYRYYTDSEERSSQAAGVKLKHYFSPQLSVHVGYRHYDHENGTDFDTLYAGFEVLL